VRAGSAAAAAFQGLLGEACRVLAMEVCRDGEGATKLVQVNVVGARTQTAARQVAKTVATSTLVKAALFGEDANWGRIMAAIGRAGVSVDPAKIGLSCDGVRIVKAGVGLGRPAERRLARIMQRREFGVTIHLGQGPGRARLWTTDLSYDYLRLNASYRS